MAISAIAGAGDNIVSTSYLYGGVSSCCHFARYDVLIRDWAWQTYNQFKGEWNLGLETVVR